MKTATPPPIPAPVVAEISTMLRSGKSHNEAVARMRALGLGKIDCIKLIREYGGATLGEAKDIVHLSPAWADRYESDEALHDTAERALDMMLAEDKLTVA